MMVWYWIVSTRLVRKALNVEGIDDGLVLDRVNSTAQSVILYDPGGRRQIHTDLKDVQSQAYPKGIAKKALRKSDLALVCNINFARPILKVAQKTGIPIATDVHALSDLDDSYNHDYMAAAKILFLSDESLPDSPENVAKTLLDKYPCEILVIGLGANGAILAVREDHYIGRFPAVITQPVVNTIGAGDALFSAFLDGFLRSQNPYDALRRAMVFASYKIGEKGAAEGFICTETLDEWVKEVYKNHPKVRK